MSLKHTTRQLILLLLVCKVNWCGGISCFQFYDVAHEIIIPENATIEINVMFNYTCNAANTTLKYVNVNRRVIGRPLHESLCRMYHLNGECKLSLKDNCKCNESTYTVFKNMSGPSKENWFIQAELQNGTMGPENLTFYLREPAQLTSLSVREGGKSEEESNSLIVDVNSQITITCTWKKGLSREVARLYINGQQVKTARPAMRKIVYTTNAQCQNNGTISCRVPSTLETSSKHLFVRCKPNFVVVENNYTFPDNSRQLLFAIKTHGLNITNCTLQRFPPEGIIARSQARINRPKCQMLPTGILAVELENLTSKKVGAWNLNVWNRFGFDAINFTIADAREDPVLFKETTAVMIAAALAVFGVTVLTIAVAIMWRFKKAAKKRIRGRRSTRSRQADSVQGSHNGVVPGAFYRSSNVSLMITNDIYASTPRDCSLPNSVQQEHCKDPVVTAGSCSPPPCGPILWSMKPSSDLFCTDSKFAIPGERRPEQTSEPGACKLASPTASHLDDHFSQGRAAEEEGDYAEIDDCKKEGDVVHASSNVYVDVAEIQRRKREQRKQKEVCN